MQDRDDIAEPDRRSVLKRGALAGGALLWAVPVVQSLASPAYATGTAPPPPAGCVSGTLLAFKNEHTGNSPDGSLASDTNGPCQDPNSVGKTVTQDGSLVSVVYSQAPAAPGAPPNSAFSQAVITLAPGYVLVSVTTKSGNQAGATCPVPTQNPVSIGTAPNGGRQYLVMSTSTNKKGQAQDISHITGVIRCS